MMKPSLEKHKYTLRVNDNDDEYSQPYLTRQNKLAP